MNNKSDSLLREQDFSAVSSLSPQGENATTELDAWNTSQSANFSTGSSSVLPPATTDLSDASKVPVDTQSKWDDILGSAGPATGAQEPPPADFQGATDITRLAIPPTKGAIKQTINPALKALQDQISKRTASIDAATKEKEAKILAASREYIELQRLKREKHIAEAKDLHRKTQDDDEKKLEDFQRRDAVWNAVGMVVDLQKPNPYSKNTERMRSILSELNQHGEITSE